MGSYVPYLGLELCLRFAPSANGRRADCDRKISKVR